MGRGKEKSIQLISFHSDFIGAHEEGLSPLYCFFQEHEFRRFEDVLGKTGWIVGVYDSIPQCHDRSTPEGVVVYYDDGYLAVVDPSRII